jgi:hypothetical protein
MISKDSPQSFSLLAEIIEVLHDDQKKIVKVFFKPGYVELPMDIEEEFHLGDEILLNGEITFREIIHNTLNIK